MRLRPRWLVYAGLLAAGVVLVVYIGLATGVLAPYLGGYEGGNDDYEHVTVTVVDGETGAELGQIEAAVADTFTKRYVGLSETDSLPEDRGMLFVHDDVGNYTYVMRDMDFGIDILFVDADGTITEIHEAPAPGPDEDGADQQYTGRGKYVLEVNYGWSDERDVEPGDRVEFEL